MALIAGRASTGPQGYCIPRRARRGSGAGEDVEPRVRQRVRKARFPVSRGPRRWTKYNGGMTVSLPICAAGNIDFNDVRGHRIAFDAKDVSFKSHGVALVGRLVMPKVGSAVGAAICHRIGAETPVARSRTAPEAVA
jgi:hypothetical protein